MGSWVHRTSRQFLDSVSPSSLPEDLANYISEPDLLAVEGFTAKYWVIAGDTISLMDQAARDAVDAAGDSDQLDEIADGLEQARTITRAFAEVVLDEINILRAQHSLPARTLTQLHNAVRGKL